MVPVRKFAEHTWLQRTCLLRSYDFIAAQCYAIPTTGLTLEQWLEKHGITHIKRLLLSNGGGPENAQLKPIADVTEKIQYKYTGGVEHGDLHDLAGSGVPPNMTNYDFVLLPQTTEHLYNPHRAFQEIADRMAPCGYLYVHQPWINKHHSTPFHFWHGTGTAQILLLETVGLKVVDYRDWGNWEYIERVLKYPKKKWPQLHRLKGPIASETKRYVQTALLARKLPCNI